MGWFALLTVSLIAIIFSMKSLWVSMRIDRHFFSVHNLFLLCLIYTTVLVAFGISYLVLEEVGLSVLEEDGKVLDVHSFQMVEVCMYFSAITLLSVGYGDITPVGIGRWIAIVEALVGYTMPAAFVARTFIGHERRD